MKMQNLLHKLDRGAKIGVVFGSITLAGLFAMKQDVAHAQSKADVASVLGDLLQLKGEKEDQRMLGYLLSKQGQRWHEKEVAREGKIEIEINNSRYVLADGVYVVESNEIGYAGNVEDVYKTVLSIYEGEYGEGPFLIEDGLLSKVNPGWYKDENGKFKNAKEEIKKASKENFENYYEPQAPQGLYTWSEWIDEDGDDRHDAYEHKGLNKKSYNIAKEKMYVALNVPGKRGPVSYTVFRDGRIIGVTSMSKFGPSKRKVIGPGIDPNEDMDMVDRLHFDVIKNGPGLYTITAAFADKEFDTYSRKVYVSCGPHK